MIIACVRCSAPMRVAKNGVPLEETFRKTGEPYRLWMTDVYSCGSCGAEIALVGAAQQPLAEHYQVDYEDRRARYAPQVVVPV